MPRPWVKIHIECLDNPKVATLTLSLRGIWFTALLVAERYDKGGSLPAADRFALMANTDEDTAKKAYAALAKKGLLDETPDGYCIHDWRDWQTRKPSDEPERVRERVARHREKQKQSVTPRNACIALPALPALHEIPSAETKVNGPDVTPQESHVPITETTNVTPRNAGNALRVRVRRDIKRQPPTEVIRRDIKRQPPTEVSGSRQAAHRLMFGALAKSFGEPAPGDEKKRYETAAAHLVTAGANPEEIPHLHEAWEWVNPGPPRVNSLAGQLRVLREAQPRGSPNGKSPYDSIILEH